MSWLTDSLIFYIGIAMAALSFVFLIFHFVISKILLSKLDLKLNVKYGERPVKTKERKLRWLR